MADLPNTIGKYHIRSLLGEGAMGIVYEGFDTDIERRVAIKILHPHLMNEKTGEEFLERFKREARSAARCTHPNVVTVLEYGQDGDTPYIVMEFVDGASLYDILKNGRSISLKNTLSIISQLLKALHSAHQLEIIHRDIKTANIMILKDGGGVKLADFGIARIAESSQLTMTGAIVGTPRYMAPEQMFGDKADKRSDLFSVSMVFLELLIALPKNTQIPCSSLPAITGLPANNRINYNCLYPNALIPMLVKGLAQSPDKRFQSAREFVAAIKSAIPNLNSAPSTSEGDATQILKPPTHHTPGSEEEFDSMTLILSDYIGPIAKNIIRAQSSSYDSLSGLAEAVAREIPQLQEREEFLRTWEKSSGTRIDATAIIPPSRNATSSPERTPDNDILNKIRDDYATYIGPLSGRLIQHYSTETNSLELLINQLASEIPDIDERQKFRQHWLHV